MSQQVRSKRIFSNMIVGRRAVTKNVAGRKNREKKKKGVMGKILQSLT